MFSPIGYTSLFDLVRSISIEGERIFRLQWEEEQACDFHPRFKRSLRDSIESAILHYLGENICICSPIGNILNIDSFSLAASEFISLDIIDIIGINLGMENEMEVFFGNQMLCKIYDPELQKSYSHIFSDEARKYQLENFYMTVPRFHDRTTYTVSCKGFEIQKRFEPIIGDVFWNYYEVMKSFIGFSYCVPNYFIDGDSPGAMASKSLASIEIEDQQKNRVGRPNWKRKALMDAYQHIYPDGHGETQYKVVLQEVNSAAGTSAKIDTLLRAIKDIDAGD